MFILAYPTTVYLVDDDGNFLVDDEDNYLVSGSPDYSVALKDPEYSNIVRYNTGAITRENRHGQAKVFTDTDWPIIKTNVYTFTTLIFSQIVSLKSFLDNTAGLNIEILDHNSLLKTGYIITSDNEIITQKDNCSYDVSFEFKEDV